MATLYTLCCGSDSLTEVDMKLCTCPTVPALKLNTSITELVLRNCSITADDMALLTQSIGMLSTLKVLDMSENTLGNEGAVQLGEP